MGETMDLLDLRNRSVRSICQSVSPEREARSAVQPAFHIRKGKMLDACSYVASIIAFAFMTLILKRRDDRAARALRGIC